MTNKIFIIISILLMVAGGAKLYVSYSNKGQAGSYYPSSLKAGQVMVYSKEGCSYCINAKNLLNQKGIKYVSIDLDNNPDLYNKLVNQTGQRTVPYIFIDEEFVGGYEDLAKLVKAGKL